MNETVPGFAESVKYGPPALKNSNGEGAFTSPCPRLPPPQTSSRSFANRAGLPVIVVYDRNGKWSSPRFGLMEQPEPLPSAIAFHVWPDVSIRSTNVGWFRFGWFPSPPTPKVLAPMMAM